MCLFGLTYLNSQHGYPHKHMYIDLYKTVLPASYKQWEHEKEHCCLFVNEGKKTKHYELICH